MLGTIVFTGALLILAGVFSFAWFSQNRNVGNSGLEISVRAEDYELLIERTARYAEHAIIVGEGHAQDSLEAAFFDLTETSTSSAPYLAYELVNEYRYENQYNLMPGSYGTLTFYLRPRRTGNLSVTFSLGLGGYVLTYDLEGNESFDAVESETVLTLLKGHLLFFTARTGATFETYAYDGIIEDGTFTYNTAEHALCNEVGKTDCYKITLYWEWPITYYDIVDDISDGETTRRFPEETEDYLENTEYFFLSVPQNATLTQLSDAYNDADQAIGTGLDCIVVCVGVR